MDTILNMSTSLNGIAARENNSTGFLTHGEWPMFTGLVSKTGALVWGRKTHEIVRGYGEQVMLGFADVAGIVLSRDASFAVEPGWKVATSPQHALELLEAAGHKQAVLGGGGTVNSAFARAGLINHVIFYIDSIVVGNGYPVFAAEPFELPLQLESVDKAGDEVIEVKYRVAKPASD